MLNHLPVATNTVVASTRKLTPPPPHILDLQSQNQTLPFITAPLDQPKSVAVLVEFFPCLLVTFVQPMPLNADYSCAIANSMKPQLPAATMRDSILHC